MFKKISVISLIFIIAFILIFLILGSISKALNSISDDEKLPQISEIEEMVTPEGELIFEEEFEPEETMSIISQDLTVEEEIMIGEKLTQFLSLNEVASLTNEEWIELDKKIEEIELEELKGMTLGDFIEILRSVKN